MSRFIRYPKHVAKAVIDNDFSGMAAEMGFMLMLGIFPAMQFSVGWVINPL